MPYRKRSSKSPKKSPKDGGDVYKSLKPLSNLHDIKRKAKADQLNQESKFCSFI